jgi:sec-independent protein translocase protein TatB
MFSSVGWGEVLILLVAALVILGPERLPGAISATMGAFRKARDYATGASKDLQEQMGTDFDAIREPLQQLNELRQMTPKALVTRHLFDGDASVVDDLENSVRDSLSLSGPAPSDPHPVAPAAPGDPGPGTQVDPGRLNAQPEPPVPPAAGDPASRRPVTDWDAT